MTTTMTARFDALCPACGSTITTGSGIARHNELSTPQLAAWVHVACISRPLAVQFVSRFKEVAVLGRAPARSVAMHIGEVVTRNKKYMEHVEVCYRAAAATCTASKWLSAVALATGKTVSAESAPEAPQAASVDPAVLAKLLDEVRASAREEARKAALEVTPREIVVRVNEGAAVKVEGRVHKSFERLLKMVASGCNVWLAGPAGSGKTTAAEQVAKSLGIPFFFNGAIDSEYKLSGFVDANGNIVSTAFRRAYTEGGLYLFDEVDASLPGATLAFNAALANGACDFPGIAGATAKHPNFRCVAAGNTWGFGATAEYVGRNKLDAAFLDRFVQLTWDYDEELEASLADNAAWCKKIQKLRAAARNRGLKVVISPRATIYGCALLRAGLSEAEALEACVSAKLTKADWENLRAAA